MTSDLCAKVTGLFAPPDQKCLRRFLKSRDRRGPGLKLLVASQPLGETAGVAWVATPEEASAATRLNALLARVATPYCLIIPGNGQWPRRPRLEAMIRPLAEDRCDLVSGSTIDCCRGWTLFARKTLRQEQATLAISGSAARLEPAEGPAVEGLVACDVGSSYLAGRTSDLRRIGGWDETLLPDEQIELYVRARRFGVRTAWCRDARVQVWRRGAGGPPPLSVQAVAQMGFAELTDLDGRQVVAPQRSLAA